MRQKINRCILILLLVLFTFSSSACKQMSEAAKAADALISSIGVVTLDSEPAIIAAEQAVAALSEEDRSSLPSLEKLEQARLQFDSLVDAKAVEEAEAAISAIGNVTVDSKAAIDAARQAYDSLDERLKADVSNASLLTDADNAYQAALIDKAIAAIASSAGDHKAAIDAARKAYDDAPEEVRAKVSSYADLTAAEEAYILGKAANIENEIRRIGTVTLESGELIASARKLYDDADPEVKEKVSNYETLTVAEETFTALRVGEVEGLIAAIGSVTADSGEAIAAAREAYDKLNRNEQSRVSNLAVLTEAEAAYTNALKDKAMSMLSSLVKSEDKFQGCAFYFPSSWPGIRSSGDWYADKRCFILPYLGVNDSYIWGRMVINYTEDDWVFWKKCTVLCDGERYTHTYSYFDIVRDNSRGRVWEYCDDDMDIEMLRAIADSTEAIVRLEGSDYYFDFTISASDKNAIKTILEIYDALIAAGVYRPYN